MPPDCLAFLGREFAVSHEWFEELELVGGVVVAGQEYQVRQRLPQPPDAPDRVDLLPLQGAAKRLTGILLASHEHRLGLQHATRLKVDELVKRGRALVDRRNALIHSSWGQESPDSVIHRYKVAIGSKGSLNVTVEPAETEAVRKLADELRDLYHEFGRFGNDIRTALGSKTS